MGAVSLPPVPFTSPPLTIPMTGPSEVAHARRTAATCARSLGFDADDEARVALVATELATNLVRYADNGRLLIRPRGPRDSAIELIVLDEGPGIEDIALWFRDWASSGNSLGAGLGAIDRMSDRFEISSTPGRGTAAFARLEPRRDPATSASRSRRNWAAVDLPAPAQVVNGDSYAVERRGDRTAVLVADGLGHGPEAAEAAGLAVEVFRALHRSPVEEIVAAIHAELPRTRGAVVAVAEIDSPSGIVRFCGLGNIRGMLVAPGVSRDMISQNGIAGHVGRRLSAQTYPVPADGLVVLHSDGLRSHWSLADYPGLLGKDPLLVAAVLARDYLRGNDDATVVVLRPGGPL